MSNEYLIPQFIIDYHKKCLDKNGKPHNEKARIFSTPEIEEWFSKQIYGRRTIFLFISKGFKTFSLQRCKYCKKPLSELQIWRNAEFCSVSCHNKLKNSSEEFKTKLKKRFQELYGGNSAMVSKKVQEKAKETFLKHWGYQYATQAKENRLRQHKTKRSQYWDTFCANLKKKNIVPMFSKEEYINSDDTGRKFRCLICGEIFQSEGLCRNFKRGYVTTLSTQNIFCPHCFKAPTSKKEKEVLEFVKSIYSGEILENHKGLFPNKLMELDIYLPQLNLGIEFDGDYWHSKEGAKEKDEKKNQLCEEKGIKLLRIKESDWSMNPDKVKEEIKYFLINRDSE